MRYNKRDHFSVAAPVMDFRAEVVARTIQEQAARKGRVVIWPSITRQLYLCRNGDGLVLVRGQTAARPNWKRKN